MALKAVSNGVVGCIDYMATLKGVNNALKLLYSLHQTVKLIGVQRADALASEVHLLEVTMFINGLSFPYKIYQFVRKELRRPVLPREQQDLAEKIARGCSHIRELFLIFKKYVPHPYHNIISDAVLGIPYIVQGYLDWSKESASEKKIRALAVFKGMVEELDWNTQKSRELQKIQRVLEDEKEIRLFLSELEHLKNIIRTPIELKKKRKELKDIRTMIKEGEIKLNERLHGLNVELGKAKNGNEEEKLKSRIEEISYLKDRASWGKAIHVMEERIDFLEQRIVVNKENAEVDPNDEAKLLIERERLQRAKCLDPKLLNSLIDLFKTLKKNPLKVRQLIELIDGLKDFFDAEIEGKELNDKIKNLKKAHKDNIGRFMEISSIKMDAKFHKVDVGRSIAGIACQLFLVKYFESMNERLIHCNKLALQLDDFYETKFDRNVAISLRHNITSEVEHLRALFRKMEWKAQQVGYDFSFVNLFRQLDVYFSSVGNIRPKPPDALGKKFKELVRTPFGSVAKTNRAEYDEQFDNVMMELEKLRQVIDSQREGLLNLLKDEITGLQNRAAMLKWLEKWDPRLKIIFGMAMMGIRLLKDFRIVKNTKVLNLLDTFVSFYFLMVVVNKLFVKPFKKSNYTPIYIKDFTEQRQPVPA